jgi:hypothetical protein
MDKDVLLKRKATDRAEAVELDEGVTVTVRALSRGEVQRIKDENASAHTYENRLIAAANVDPKLTPVEVAEWLDEAPAGDSVSIMEAVIRLSGMGEGSPKSSV